MDYLKKRLRAERSRPRRPSPPPPLSASLNRLLKLLHLAPSVPPGFTPGGGAAVPKVKKKQDDEDDGDDQEESVMSPPLPRDWPPVPKRPRTAVLFSPVCSSPEQHHGDGRVRCTEEVAAALDRLAGMYEKAEAAKQRKAERLEEWRLEAMRDLEIKRMRMLVDAAVSTYPGTPTAVAAAGGGLVEELGH